LKKAIHFACVILVSTAAYAGVSITSPSNGATVSSPVHVVASAGSDLGRPTSSIIIYVDNANKYTTYSNHLDTSLSMANGWHTILIKSWDSGGAIVQKSVSVNVSGSGSSTSNGITVTSPLPGSTVGSPAQFNATAKSSTGYPISSMMLFVDNVEKFRTYSASLSTSQSLSTGSHKVIVKAWDNSGKEYDYPYSISAGQSSSPPATQTAGTAYSGIEQMSGWASCDVCAGAGGSGPAAPHSLTQNVSSPSLDGHSAKFWLGGTTRYSDVLWWKQVIPESKASFNATLHHFVYDLNFMVDNPTGAQSIEWDVNQFVSGRSYIFGSQCSYRSAGTWDVWDNVNSHWVSTGIKCPALQAWAWNHVTLEFERTSDNKLHYISLTLNGTKHYLNWYYASTATSWSGVTVNYQMDGNYAQTDYTTWVDKMQLNVW
jgi:hypothetical protein